MNKNHSVTVKMSRVYFDFYHGIMLEQNEADVTMGDGEGAYSKWLSMRRSMPGGPQSSRNCGPHPGSLKRHTEIARPGKEISG